MTQASPEIGHAGGHAQPLRGSAILDEPPHVPAVWGHGADVLWAEGEPLIIAGPPGVGKTTLAQQVTLDRCGVARDLEVLGYLVTPAAGRVLYVAADRPRQAMRSMRRMVRPDQRRELDERLAIWPGPFWPFSSTKELLELLRVESISTVVLDSIKDVASGDPGDPNVGSAFNRTIQAVIASGVEVLALHHNRKAQEGNRHPRKRDDLYGSQWIAAGVGSVLYLVGEAGDATVELRHLKKPAGEVGPLTIVHDHDAGISRVLEGTTVAGILEAASADGITVKAAAAQLFATDNPDRNQVEKARRKLDAIERSGGAAKVEATEPGASAVYRRVTPVTPAVTPSREPSRVSTNGLSSSHATVTHPHGPGSDRPSSPKGGGRDPIRDGEDKLVDAIREVFGTTEVEA